MFKYTNQFVEFCKKGLSFQLQASYGYQSLPACIIDCVYSLRAQYFSTTVPVVERYANAYMNSDRFAACDKLSDLVQHIILAGGSEKFAEDILKNKQKSGGVIKSEVCLNLAKYLGYLHIETMQDFKDFESP